MALSGKSLALLLVALVAVAPVTYAAKPKIIDVPGTPMTVVQARKAMTESLSHLAADFSGKLVGVVRFNRQGVSYIFHSPGYGASDMHAALIFAELANLSVRKNGKNDFNVCLSDKSLPFISLPDGGKLPAWFNAEQQALRFVDALLTLKAAALAPDPEEANFAAFTASAQAWRATAPKPEMPDDARAQKLLAEDAFKRKDFAAALDAYGDALDKFPMWPEGHYNAALLAAETLDYDLAAQHMRRYLVLAPEAKDAAAAKDKLLLWQVKAKQQGQ